MSAMELGLRSLVDWPWPPEDSGYFCSKTQKA